MHHQRILSAALLVVAVLMFLPSAFVSSGRTSISVTRATPILDLPEMEGDAFLAAVHVEVGALVESDPDMTVEVLMARLRTTHTTVLKLSDGYEYEYLIVDGQQLRVCTRTTVVSVVDPTRITPVHVTIVETINV